MKVSVIVPTRNRSAWLRMTLRSVLCQRDVDLEVIVVDEASTDDTPAALAALGEPRLRVIRHDTPHGVSAARNIGVAEARGTWVAFLDDDDLWAPDKLTRQLSAARAAGREWVYAGSVNVDGRRIVHGQPPLSPERAVAALPRYNAIPAGASNVVVRRDALLRAGPFDTRLRNTEDWEMWIRLSRHGPPACVCSPLVAYRMHPSSSSLNVHDVIQGVRLIEELHGTTADWARFHRWIAQLCLRNGRRGSALSHYIWAGLRGQGRSVAQDLVWAARDAVYRRVHGNRPAPARSINCAWRTEARRWLEELWQTDGRSQP